MTLSVVPLTMAYKQPYEPFAWMTFRYGRQQATRAPSANAAAAWPTYENSSARASKRCDTADVPPVLSLTLQTPEGPCAFLPGLLRSKSMKPLRLKHAEIYIDEDGWLRIGKHNGEELALQLEPGDYRLSSPTWRV